MHVLIVSVSIDPHADAVARILRKNGVKVVFLQTDRFSPSRGLLCSPGSANPYLVLHNRRKITPTGFSSIWIRKPFTSNFHENLSNRDRTILEFKLEEAMHLLVPLFLTAARDHTLIVNEQLSGYLAKYKADQLITAHKLGFRIPDTVISTDITTLYDFIGRHGNTCILKDLGNQINYPSPTPATGSTKVISLTDIRVYYKNKVLDYPLFLQEKIPKAYELRITVMGNRLFACSIGSQALPQSQTDWRLVLPSYMKHEIVKLPAKIEALCLDLCRHYGLQFGAIDMAVTPDGEYVFFEINPGGQYLWIEKLTGAPLSQAMAELLSEPDKYKL